MNVSNEINCGKLVKYSYVLDDHISYIHLETWNFKCFKCDNEFKNSNALDEHLR